MKNIRSISFLIVLLVGMCLPLTPGGAVALDQQQMASFDFTGSPQKSKAATDTINIDEGAAPLTGKQVYYFLTDAEGGTQLDALGQTRKVPAWILYNYRGRRDDAGHLVSPLLIGRPGFAGGVFTKDDVAPDESRTPGNWDTRKPGDLRN